MFQTLLYKEVISQIKAKLHYTSFPVASQEVRNINDKSVTSWQLPRLRRSKLYGETRVMDFGHETV